LLRYSLPVQSALLMFADNGSDSIVLSKSDRRFIQESADESVPNIYSLCVCVLMSFSSGIPPPLHLGVLQICGIFFVYLSVWQYWQPFSTTCLQIFFGLSLSSCTLYSALHLPCFFSAHLSYFFLKGYTSQVLKYYCTICFWSLPLLITCEFISYYNTTLPSNHSHLSSLKKHPILFLQQSS